MTVGARHLGWCHPSQKIHVVTITWEASWKDGDVLTARSDCGSSVTSVLEKTVPERRDNLCKRCERKAPELRNLGEAG